MCFSDKKQSNLKIEHRKKLHLFFWDFCRSRRKQKTREHSNFFLFILHFPVDALKIVSSLFLEQGMFDMIKEKDATERFL